jgi:hypothetical protein
MEAGAAIVPRPMIVQDGTGHVYEPVMDGVCGFASVTVFPGTSSFARWASKNAGWRKAYGGGMQLWVGQFNQSMTRKEAYARAFAQVLRDGGFDARSGSLMD